MKENHRVDVHFGDNKKKVIYRSSLTDRPMDKN